MTQLQLDKITINRTYGIYQVQFMVFFDDKSLPEHQDQITIEVNLPIEDEASLREIEAQAMTKAERLLRLLLGDIH